MSNLTLQRNLLLTSDNGIIFLSKYIVYKNGIIGGIYNEIPNTGFGPIKKNSIYRLDLTRSFRVIDVEEIKSPTKFTKKYSVVLKPESPPNLEKSVNRSTKPILAKDLLFTDSSSQERPATLVKPSEKRSEISKLEKLFNARFDEFEAKADKKYQEQLASSQEQIQRGFDDLKKADSTNQMLAAIKHILGILNELRKMFGWPALGALLPLIPKLYALLG
jgi:hypothetical protein